MNFILFIPIELRLAVLFVIGAFLGGQLNRAIYSFAFYKRRAISPWQRADEAAPPRHWSDRLPIVGWFGLRREASLHGAAFWIRPLLLELFVAIGLVWLYHWEITGGLLPAGMRPKPGELASGSELVTMLHGQFVLHAALIALMLVATFIDFDEQLIPDEVTVPGTILALVIAAAWPATRLPTIINPIAGPAVEPLLASSPDLVMPDWVDGERGLMCGIACLAAWCLAIMPKLVYFGDGTRKAFQYFFAHILRPKRKGNVPQGAKARRPHVVVLADIVVFFTGPVAIALVWNHGGPAWHGLFSALVGMAFAGGLVWAIRIIGTYALQVEAMGFGDVTLMAMIGAFLGWQPALIAFFLAPFAAILIAIAQKIFTRESHIAFGPYLCFGALLTILLWHTIWNRRADGIFGMGWIIPGMVGCCLVMMGVMLFAWRLIKMRLFAPPE